MYMDSSYPRKSIEHILYSLSVYGILFYICDEFKLNLDDKLTLNEKPFCSYLYFDELELPVFKFINHRYTILRTDKGFNLTLDKDLEPSVYIDRYVNVLDNVSDLINNMKTNTHIELSKEAGVYIKDLDVDKYYDGFTINFTNLKNINKWLEEFNKIYISIVYK